MPQRVLAISAHIGDEILGCGGTLLRHVIAGDDVRIVVMGEGWTSRTSSLEKGLEAIDLDLFERQAREALGYLSITNVDFHRLPDNRFDRMALLDLVKIVESHKRQFMPTIVYSNSTGDLGIDQRLTSRAVLTAFRPLPGEQVSKILAFEVRSSSDWAVGFGEQGFQPNCFVNIADTLQAKIDAFSALRTEVRSRPHSRSVEAIASLAHSRGASVGLEAAEAFSILRSVIR